MAFDVQDLLARIKDLPDDAKNAVLDAVSKVKNVGDLGDVLREHGINLSPDQLKELFANLKDHAGSLLDRDKDGKVGLVDRAKNALDKDHDGKLDLAERAGDALRGAKDRAKDALDKDHDGKLDVAEKIGDVFHRKSDAS